MRRALRGASVGLCAAVAVSGCSRDPAAAPAARGTVAAKASPRRHAGIDAPPVAVVELFTSEGCSSCPPADRNLVRIVRDARKTGRRVYALSFHVDYWNSLGWRDRFSSARYSARQRHYTHKFGSSSLYTPEMIVNGDEAFVGSEAARADAAIARALRRRARARLALSIEPGGEPGRVRVRFSAEAGDRDAVVDLALVQRAASSRVTRGENEGRTLIHANVVRAFKRFPFAGKTHGAWRPTVSAKLVRAPRKLLLIGYVQDARSLRVLGASRAVLRGTAAGAEAPRSTRRRAR